MSRRCAGRHPKHSTTGEIRNERGCQLTASGSAITLRLQSNLRTLSADLNCAHAGLGNYYSCLFGIGNRTAARARVRDAADKADACGERARQIGSQPRRPYLKVIRTSAVSNNRVDETVTARKNRIAIMARMSHYDDPAAEQFGTLALLFLRLQSGRIKPLVYARGCFGLPAFAHQFVALSPGRQRLGLLSETLCFLR
jgi:hypothetical protein